MSEVISGGKWLGVEGLVIPQDLLSIVSPSKSTSEAFWSLPTNIFKSEDFRIGAKRVNEKFPQMDNYPNIAIQCTWELFRTANSVNRSFNSKTYSTAQQLQSVYNSWMNKLKFGFWETRALQLITTGHNHVFNIPSVTTPLSFSGSELLPVLSPGILDLHTAISKLAELFISMFKFSASITEMVRLAVVGIVTKIVDVSGASAIRYAIAKLFKGGAIPLPPAELGNAAWSMLMQYGGYIIAVSILVILAYKLSQKPPATAVEILLTYQNGWQANSHNPIPEEEFLVEIALDSNNIVFGEPQGLMNAFLFSDKGDLVRAYQQQTGGIWVESVTSHEELLLRELRRLNLRLGTGKWYKIN